MPKSILLACVLASIGCRPSPDEVSLERRIWNSRRLEGTLRSCAWLDDTTADGEVEMQFTGVVDFTTPEGEERVASFSEPFPERPQLAAGTMVTVFTNTDFPDSVVVDLAGRMVEARIPRTVPCDCGRKGEPEANEDTASRSPQ